VDNGKQLPIWNDLPHFTYWLLPLVVATPLAVAGKKALSLAGDSIE
jgi:hypothetical protein